MNALVASGAGGPRRPEHEREERPVEGRRSRARRNALLLGLLAAAFYVGFILLGLLKGIFPG